MSKKLRRKINNKNTRITTRKRRSIKRNKNKFRKKNYRLTVTVGAKRKQKGRGLLNWVINKLPFEAHLPGYSYCGPGTKLEQRLARGDKGVNELDEACKQHDIAYSKSNNVAERNEADRMLRDKASEIASKSKHFGEKLISKAVSKIMDVKQARNW